MKQAGILSPARFSLLLATQMLIAIVLCLSRQDQALPAPSALASSWLDLLPTPALLSALWESMQMLLLALLLSSGTALAVVAIRTLPEPHKKWLSFFRLMLLGAALRISLQTVNPVVQPRLTLLAWALTLLIVPSLFSAAFLIPQGMIDHCRVLGMKSWRIIWELVVLGKAEVMLDLIRQTAAIGWALLILLEILSASGNGMGDLLFNPARHYPLSTLLAIQLTILAYALAQDFLLGKLKQALCPHVNQSGVTP